MQSSRLLGAALAAILLSVSAAKAFSTDDRTLNDANGQPRFSDPDEQMPTQGFSIGTGSASYGQQNSDGNGQSPSSYAPSAAPFAPSNGYYLPRH